MRYKKKRFFLIIFLFIPSLINASDKINIFFNKSVDSSVTSINYAKGNVALDSLLCTYIHNAQYSIDCCIYSFNDCDWDVGDSLIEAHKRGVNVRFITDDKYMTGEVQDLLNAGITVINDDFPSVYDGHYNMHNKFFIFDYRDSSVYTDDWVWTGSYNVTYWGYC